MTGKRINKVVVATLCTLLLFTLSGCGETTYYNPENLELASESLIKLSDKVAERTISASEEEANDMISAYAYFLYEQGGGFLVSDSTLCFSLAYIDEDDIQELVICNGTESTDNVWVYKYDPSVNDVKLIGGFGEYGSMVYYPQKNLIEDSFLEAGSESSSYYSIDDMDLVSLNYLSHDLDRGLYYIDNEECDRDSYYEARTQYSSLGDACIISCDAMTRYSKCCKDQDTIDQALYSYVD